MSNLALPLFAVTRILLTSFDPFGGSGANNSQPIAQLLQQHPEWIGSALQVQVCNLPVVYDQGAAKAMTCINQFKPDVVVSFGEADCSLRIETAATNLDDTPGYPDNAGLVREGSEIVAGGPERSAFQFPVQAMYCGLDSNSAPVQVSETPGAFVCNNVAYHLSQSLEAKKIPFTFIHVPNSECSAGEKDPTRNAKTVAQMLRGALTEIDKSNAKTLGFMPATADQADALLQTYKTQKAPACEVKFASELTDAYRNNF
jgi:pyroglutamyl-peptidase